MVVIDKSIGRRVIPTLRKNTPFPRGAASANFEKNITFQSGSSARTDPLGVSHFSSAWSSFLFTYDEISSHTNILAVVKVVGRYGSVVHLRRLLRE